MAHHYAVWLLLSDCSVGWEASTREAHADYDAGSADFGVHDGTVAVSLHEICRFDRELAVAMMEMIENILW